MESCPEWEFLAKKYQQYPNILAIVDLILTFSPSSAQAERGFSQLKIVKSDLRNRLGQTSLNNILAIKFLSNDIHAFNPDNAVANFFMTKNRRLRVRKTVPACASVSVLQSDRGGVRVVEVDHETERENSEPEMVREKSVTVDERESDTESERVESEIESDSENELQSEDEETVYERLQEIEMELEREFV